MKIEVVTLFPELFESPLRAGLVGKAFAEQRASIGFVDPRSFATDRHRSVDDSPYGGGAGMVMKVDVLTPAIEEARRRAPGARVVLLCPQGRCFDQATARRFAAEPGLVLVCGRYEGFDERVRSRVDEEVSIGDFVLTGGEMAALAIIDAVVRLKPGTLGNVDSASSDSFEAGLLEHPHYTRPSEFRGQGVPEVLLGGDHAAVATWRRAASLLRTRERRPELLLDVDLSIADELALAAGPSRRAQVSLGTWAVDPSFVRAALELAQVYELAGLHFLAADEGAEDTTRQLIEAFGREIEAPPPRRRANAKQKMEDAKRELLWVRRRALADASRVHRTLAELHEVTAEATWIGHFESSDPAVGPRVLSAELLGASPGDRFLLAWHLGTPPAGVRRHRVVLGRAGALDSGNTGALGLAVLLDRLLGAG